MTAVNLGYGLMPGQTKKPEGRLVNAVQQTAGTHICELKPLSHERSRKRVYMKVCAEGESGSETTTMSQPLETQLLRLD